VADNVVCLKELSKTFKEAEKPLKVLVECDTGALRCGVVTPEEACSLAKEIEKMPGLRFGGLMTYPPISQQKKSKQFFRGSKKPY
jgi:D-serine deaminase-like pyridoxal phosphate-dependent protein